LHIRNTLERRSHPRRPIPPTGLYTPRAGRRFFTSPIFVWHPVTSFLDGVRLQWVGWTPRRGDIIPHHESKDAGSRGYDFNRLERVVRKLAKQHERAVRRSGQLVEELERRDQRIRVLEEELLASNQCRLDVVKRIDELIAQIDQLDLQLQSLEDRK
jgi:hypothetical protein